MSKDRKKVLHIHSSVNDKQPTPATLELGELGINNAGGNAFLSTKNSNNEVVRFSEDDTIINWMEYKEVFPYEAYTRGSDGQKGVTESDLLSGKSNIIIKLNQVVPNNTVYNDKVNGAKDIYNREINPISSDLNKDGAGLAIDMSAYVLSGGNPSFSSLTVSNKTTLNGDTIINGNTTVNGPITFKDEIIIDGPGFNHELKWTYGDVRNEGSGSTNYATDASFKIPRNIDDLTNWNGNCVTIGHNVCVDGTITASGAIYSSDMNLKENIKTVSRNDFNKAKLVQPKSFNFKDDESKRKTYGVIAQDVENVGLDELVYVKEDGFKAVDYTSLMMLKIAYLEDFCATLNGKIYELNEKIKELENKKK